MTLPRFQFSEEEDGDATAPAEFVLKLPASYARKLARFESAAPLVWPTPSAPWTIETAPPASTRAPRTTLVAVLASLAVAIVVLAGVGGAVALAGDGEGPVGISMRAPKSLDGFVRAAVRESGGAPRVRAATVPVEWLHRARHRPHARRRR